jgi:hypothetical protein
MVFLVDFVFIEFVFHSLPKEKGGRNCKKVCKHVKNREPAPSECGNGYSNTNRNSGCNGHANPNTYAHAVHGEMCADAATAPHASRAPVASI